MRNSAVSSIPTIIVLLHDIYVHTQRLHSKWDGVGREGGSFYHNKTDHKWGQSSILEVSKFPNTGDIFLAISFYFVPSHPQPVTIQLPLSYL